MNILKLHIIILTHLFFTFDASAQWVLKNNGLPVTRSTGWSIDAADSNTAIISLSMEGKDEIFLTTDAGDIWSELNWPAEDESETAIDIEIISNNKIWFVTSRGRIYATANGGSGSELQFYDTTKTKFMNYIEMFDENNGIAMGDALWSDKPAIFLKTNNGGKDWISQNENNLIGFYANTWQRIDFINMNLGYYTWGMNFINKTFDGGKTWTQILMGGTNRSVKFYNETIGIITNEKYDTSTDPVTATYYFNITKNAGNDWETIESNIEGLSSDVEFVPGHPSQIWYAPYSYGDLKLYFSSDTGRTWAEQIITPNYSSVRDIYFVDEKHGWLLCDDGFVFYTENNGGFELTSLEKNKTIPDSYKLMQNYPNPFNPETTIEYQLPVSSHVSLKVYNILGKEITTLVDEFKQAGVHRVKFNSNISSSLSSGVYFYKITAGNFSEIKKMLLIK